MKEIDNSVVYIDKVTDLVNELHCIITLKVKEDKNFSKRFFDNLTRGTDIKENFKLLKKYL